MVELEQFVTYLGPQWSAPGDDKAKRKLVKQLRKNFDEEAYDWLLDPRVKVRKPERVDPDTVDYNDYPDWRAARQLKEVRDIAKKIDKGKEKPALLVQPPHGKKQVIDGHHHWMGYIDCKEDPLAWVVDVPSNTGPWQTMHDHQHGDDKKDDFGKTNKSDRND